MTTFLECRKDCLSLRKPLSCNIKYKSKSKPNSEPVDKNILKTIRKDRVPNIRLVADFT